MLNAAVLFTRGANDDMALQDSTLLHARKLVEFAATMSVGMKDVGDRGERWAPPDDSGEWRAPSGDLARFLDDWVIHLDGKDLAWPIDKTGARITNTDPARLSKVVDLVLDFLESTAADIAPSRVGGTYLELLHRAHDYWRDL